MRRCVALVEVAEAPRAARGRVHGRGSPIPRSVAPCDEARLPFGRCGDAGVRDRGQRPRGREHARRAPPAADRQVPSGLLQRRYDACLTRRGRASASARDRQVRNRYGAALVEAVWHAEPPRSRANGRARCQLVDWPRASRNRWRDVGIELIRDTGAWDVARLHRLRPDVDRSRCWAEFGVAHHGSRRDRGRRGRSRDASRRLVGRARDRPTVACHARDFRAGTAPKRCSPARDGRRSARRRSAHAGLRRTQIRSCWDCPVDGMRCRGDGSGLATSTRSIGISAAGTRPHEHALMLSRDRDCSASGERPRGRAALSPDPPIGLFGSREIGQRRSAAEFRIGFSGLIGPGRAL